MRVQTATAYCCFAASLALLPSAYAPSHATPPAPTPHPCRMDCHAAQGDMEEALTYAITSEERMRVESATKQAQAKVVG